MTRIVYETEPCSRCGGSGSYSFNLRTGSRCFKCGGSGNQLTRRGRSARDRIAKEKRRFHKPAGELRMGDQIEWLAVAPMTGATHRTWAEVAANPRPDERMPERFLKIQLLEAGKRPVSYSTAPGAVIEVLPTREEFHAHLVPLANRLKGATVIENETAA